MLNRLVWNLIYRRVYVAAATPSPRPHIALPHPTPSNSVYHHLSPSSPLCFTLFSFLWCLNASLPKSTQSLRRSGNRTTERALLFWEEKPLFDRQVGLHCRELLSMVVSYTVHFIACNDLFDHIYIYMLYVCVYVHICLHHACTVHMHVVLIICLQECSTRPNISIQINC